MFMLNRISLCILSKLDPSRSGRPSESLVNVIQYRRCGRRYSIRCGAWRPMPSVLSRGRSVQCSWRVYQDRVLLSIEVPEYDRHGIESGPWGFADFRRPTSGPRVRPRDASLLIKFDSTVVRVWAWRGRRASSSVTRQLISS